MSSTFTNNFYRGFPDYGYYVNSIRKAKHCAQSILKNNFKSTHNNFVVFDFDNTLVFTYLDKINRTHIYYNEYKLYPNIKEMFDLAKRAQQQQYYVIIVTSRYETYYEETLYNCIYYNFYPDFIFMRPINNQSSNLKQRIYHKLKKIDMNTLIKLNNQTNKLLQYNHRQQYIKNKQSRNNIVLVIGDQFSDKCKDNNTPFIKLPDDYNMNCYLFIQNQQFLI